ncbi:hypothetical protein F511_36885 [Dorcoceras hygrometricum]|uniref:Uncharacterized protein n=1 Tax=Dorcoceras hygrometricum TaxID=472368 RepID=A0A2Z7B9T0_9LAMI|nr:hypothetical protein F511_36885 [Dorcoceras hygrometricum]
MLNPKKRKHKGGATKTQTKQAATQITTTPPDTTATKIIENREIVVSTNVFPEEDSETDLCPLVQRRCKKKQVSESSDSLPLTYLLKRMRTPPDTTATKIIENREIVVSTNVFPEEDSETDLCPLVQRRCKKKQVSESSDSLPLTYLLKRMRTQRQHKPSGWTSTTQPDPISALTTAPEEFPDEQILQGGSVDNFADNLDLYDQTGQDEPNNQNVNVDHPHQIVPTEGEGTNADDEQRDHGSQDPMTLDMNLSEQGKGKVNLDDGLNNDARMEHERQPEPEYIIDANESPLHDSIPIIPVNHEGNMAYQRTTNSPQKPDDVVPIQVAQEGGNPEIVEYYCTRLIMTAREKVSSRMAIFEEWVHFRPEVRLKDFSCFQSMVDIEEQLLEWVETEDITELSERRSLILYKLLEIELEKLYLAHLANFKTNVFSAHRDFECIRRLHQELRVIAAAHRHHRGLVGLPFTTPKCDFLPNFSPALEIYNLTGTTQGSVLDTYPQHEQHVNQTATHAFYENKAQENEPLIQEADHEHLGQDRQGSIEGVDPRLNAIPISAINPEAIPRAEQDVSPHQDPDFSNLQLIATAPHESSTLQILHTATQSLNDISNHVSSLDQSYARLRYDTNITRHHTTKLCDMLKSTAEGFDIRIDVPERTLTQRMVEELAVVKSQLAVLVEDLKESGAAKRGKVDQVVDQGKGQVTVG